MSHQLQTVRDFVRFSMSEMARANCHFGHGMLNAFDESVFLVLASLELPPDHIDPFWDAQLVDREITHLLSLIDQRCRLKIPSAYLLGQTWLGGLKFKSDARALVPRSLLVEALDQLIGNTETEQWPNVALVFETAKPKILDLCTGGASIAIVASHRLNAAGVKGHFLASDISKDALTLARENIKDHGMTTQIKLLESDLFNSFKASDKFDLILCNPPYVNAESIRALPAEFKHEPIGALASGLDGMEFTARLLKELSQRLRANGSLLLEIGNEANYFEALVAHLAKTDNVAFDFQYIEVTAGKNMVVLIDAPV